MRLRRRRVRLLVYAFIRPTSTFTLPGPMTPRLRSRHTSAAPALSPRLVFYRVEEDHGVCRHTISLGLERQDTRSVLA